MAESLVTDDNNDALENTIETMLEEVMKLKDEYIRSLKTSKHEYLQSKSISIVDVETSLSNKLDLLNDAKATFRFEINAAWELVNKKREEILRLKSEHLEIQELRSKELELFDKQISEGVPKFRDALRIYSEDYLTEEIQEIKNEDQYVRNKIESIDQKIEGLVSKYNLNEKETTLIPGRETAVAELQQLKAIWMNSNLNSVSARKLNGYLNKELEGKIEINKRKLARFVQPTTYVDSRCVYPSEIIKATY